MKAKKQIRFCPMCKRTELTIDSTYISPRLICLNCGYYSADFPVISTKKINKKDLKVVD